MVATPHINTQFPFLRQHVFPQSRGFCPTRPVGPFHNLRALKSVDRLFFWSWLTSINIIEGSEIGKKSAGKRYLDENEDKIG